MKKILMSINPKHVKNIIEGTKKYEYRTRVAKSDISSIIVYSTFPTMKVVAEVEIVGILELSPEELWEKTKIYSQIDKTFFDRYFVGRKKAYAYVLGRVICFEVPLNLSDFGVNFVPQSFVYLQ
jgi:predicted transcriptional regulator